MTQTAPRETEATDRLADSASIPIYCINLPAARERRARMTRQFEHFGLLDRVHFVPAISARSAKVDQHLAVIGMAGSDHQTRAVAACWLSHVRALRTFLREQPSPVSGCIVLEDDVLLHRDWPERLEAVLGNLPDSAPVCTLGYNDEDWIRPYESWEGFAWSGRQPHLMNLTAVLTRQWGAHAYWISRRHARSVLRHDESATPLPSLIPDYVPQRKSLPVPEAIEKIPGSFSAFPSLAIQDGTSSSIREDREVREHRCVHASWGVESYFVDNGHHLTKRSASAPTICLCAVVQDESDRIEPFAASLEGFIDSWVICDTGSSDGTPERVRAAFGHLPGELFDDEWRDEGTNRSLLLERARGKADYLLLLEPSHSLLVLAQLGPLDADAYVLPFVAARDVWAPMLVRGDLPWRALGQITSSLDCGRPFRVQQLSSILVRSDQDENRRAERLGRALARGKDVAGRSGDRHHLFELAEIHRELGNATEAIGLYEERLKRGGPPEQIWEAMYRHAELVSKSDWESGVNLLLEAWEFLPSRPEPLWSLARGYRMRRQFAPAEVLIAKALQLPRPEVPPARFREVYDWRLDYEWTLVAWRYDPEPARKVCGDLLKVPTVPDDLLMELKEHYWKSYITALKGGAAARNRGAPTLQSLVPATATGPLNVDVGVDWDLSHPSIASDDDGLRCLLRLRDPDNLWVTSYCEARLSSDLSVVDARVIRDERPPESVPLAAFRRALLVRHGSGYLVVGSPEGAPTGSPVVLLALDDGRFRETERLVGAGIGRPLRWAPFVRDGELFFLTGFDPTSVLRADPKTGEVLSTTVAPRPDALSDEGAGSPGIPVEGGTLFVTNRVLADGYVEHRFVLLDADFEPAGASRGFCFFHPIGELCFGLARQGDDLVLSFGAQWGRDPFLARVPYRAVVSMLER